MTPPEPPTPDAARPENPKAEVRSAWAVPVMWMVIVLIVVGAAVYVFKSCRDLPVQTLEKTGKLVNEVGQQLEKVAPAFTRGSITTTLTTYATTLTGSQY